MSSTLRGSLLAGAGVIGLAVAALIPALRMPALLVVLILLFLAATSLSRATRIADSLPPLANRLVQVQVWGNALTVEAALERLISGRRALLLEAWYGYHGDAR